MNQEREENRIRELFHELKREDGRRAPDFDLMMKAARLRAVDTRRPRRLPAIAVAAAMLVLALVSLLIIRQLSTTPSSTERAEVVEPYVERRPPELTTAAPDKKEMVNKKTARPTAGRRVTRRPERATAMISGWRSPTDFLLNTSGRQLLSATPRLGESVASIKGLFPEVKN